MKRQIYGRKIRSNAQFKLLISSDCATSGGRKVDPEKLREFELNNTRRAVKELREKAVEGYVIFGDDPTHYMFTPAVDFVYPADKSLIVDV